MKKPVVLPFCECCGEPNELLLCKVTKPKKQWLCKSCLHGSLHNHGVCPAHEEHFRVRMARIGHFIFTNCIGEQQTIVVHRTHKLGEKYPSIA